MKRTLRQVLGFSEKLHTGTLVVSDHSPQATGPNALTLKISPLSMDVQSSSRRHDTILIPVNANPRGNVKYLAYGDSDLDKICLEGPQSLDTLHFELRYMNDPDPIGGSRGLRGQPIFLRLKFLHKL